MSQKPSYKKILNHCDRDEILNKLIIGIDAKDVHDWLAVKYTNISDSKLVISEAALKSFQSTYLDFYQDLVQDMSKTKTAITTGEDIDSIELAIKKNPAYEDAMIKLASNELNLDVMISKLAINVETRLSQIFDQIQSDPNNINTKIDRLFCEYAEMFGNVLDKYYKWKESQANQMISASANSQVIDRHISVFQDVIKEVLQNIDVDSSLLFMDLLNEKLSKLKVPELNPASTTEMRIAETKILNETINKKINEQ